MFSRYTERAQRVIVMAQEEARQAGASFVGTEHLLLGVLREGDSLAISAIRALGHDPEAIRASVLSTAEQHRPALIRREVGFIPRAKAVMVELAVQEARNLGHCNIGPEHILLGLILEGEGRAAVVLDQYGLKLDLVRRAVALGPAATMTHPMPPLPPIDTELMSRVITSAREEAGALGALKVGHEHLLMALLADPAGADLADLLRVRGMTIEWLRSQFSPS